MHTRGPITGLQKQSKKPYNKELIDLECSVSQRKSHVDFAIARSPVKTLVKSLSSWIVQKTEISQWEVPDIISELTSHMNKTLTTWVKSPLLVYATEAKLRPPPVSVHLSLTF